MGRSAPVTLNPQPLNHGRRLMRTGDYSLSPERWEEFRERHWGRAPAVLRQALAAPLMTGDEAFEAIRRACAAHRTGERRGSVRLVVDDFLLTGTSHDDILPDAGDPSPEAYAARMECRLDGRKFAVVVDSLQ